MESVCGVWRRSGRPFPAISITCFSGALLLGIGEASYGVIAPALMADLFPIERAGTGHGGLLPGPSGRHGARDSCWAARSPMHWDGGLFSSSLACPGFWPLSPGLSCSDPGRGASEDAGTRSRRPGPGMSDYLELIKTKTFVFNTLGMAAVTFATGAYATWGSAFYQRVHGLSTAEAGQRIGHPSGRSRPDRYRAGDVLARPPLQINQAGLPPARCSRRPVRVSRWAGSASSTTNTNSSLAYLFCASVLLSMVLGPCNTVTANVVAPNRRAAAYAAFIFFIHLLGDISSPILLGWVSGVFGEPDVMASSIGQFLHPSVPRRSVTPT